jgi:PAS domain S-box-containing protein
MNRPTDDLPSATRPPLASRADEHAVPAREAAALVTPLAIAVRGSRDAVLALASSAGPSGVPTRRAMSELFDDVVALLAEGRPSLAESASVAPNDAVDRAAAYSAIAQFLSGLMDGGGPDVTPRERRAVHEWVHRGLSACVDVLARDRAATEARRESQRAVFANARIFVVEFDTELRFQWVYGGERPPVELEELIGRSLEDVGHPADMGQLASRLRRVLATGEGEHCEITFTPPLPAAPEQSRTRNLLLALEPKRDASGAIVGVIGASTDVSELKETQRALGDALLFRDQMTAVLAHDLRNPLSTIRALASVFARRSGLPEDVIRGLGQVDAAAQRMHELIGTILDFSAARFGVSLPVSPTTADLHEVARAVVDELLGASPDRLITVESSGDPSGVFDPARIAEVVSNLAGNALTHGAPTHPVRVTIDGQSDGLVLAVSNVGTPIPEALVPVIFEPFRRGPTSARGLGLGLYIAKEIVDAHGGTIAVESSDAQGTVFTIRLPRSRGEARGA